MLRGGCYHRFDCTVKPVYNRDLKNVVVMQRVVSFKISGKCENGILLQYTLESEFETNCVCLKNEFINVINLKHYEFFDTFLFLHLLIRHFSKRNKVKNLIVKCAIHNTDCDLIAGLLHCV